MRTYLSTKFSTLLVDQNHIRKDNQYEWDALYSPQKNFNNIDMVNHHQSEFLASDFKIMQTDPAVQTYESSDWIFVESKYNLDNAVASLYSKKGQEMYIYLKTKIEKFCDSHLKPADFPKICLFNVFCKCCFFSFQKNSLQIW